MARVIQLLKVYPESFRANIYTIKPFRMIGLIDASIRYPHGIERVTLAFYRSSGTNNGKIEGLWYPIVGIKIHDGPFTEFTEFLNFILTNTTRTGQAKGGWLAKSLFFANSNQLTGIKGFSNGRHYKALLKIGETLRSLYENKYYTFMKSLDARVLNNKLVSEKIYPGNAHCQRENFERLIADIFYHYP